jgi:sortase A
MFKLRTFNNILSFLVVSLGLYIALTPLIPTLDYWFRDKSASATAPYSGKLAESVGSDSSLPAPRDNRIVIPSISLNEPITESNSIAAINDGGTWRRPNTATPNDNDNTVIVGHRYFGRNVSTFYHLDKVEVGQTMAIYWEGEEIIYQVTEKKVVDPSAIEIEAQTGEKQLTLYTCTPVWTAKDRLVIIAKPIEDSGVALR